MYTREYWLTLLTILDISINQIYKNIFKFMSVETV